MSCQSGKRRLQLSSRIDVSSYVFLKKCTWFTWQGTGLCVRMRWRRNLVILWTITHTVSAVLESKLLNARNCPIDYKFRTSLYPLYLYYVPRVLFIVPLQITKWLSDVFFLYPFGKTSPKSWNNGRILWPSSSYHFMPFPLFRFPIYIWERKLV